MKTYIDESNFCRQLTIFGLEGLFGWKQSIFVFVADFEMGKLKDLPALKEIDLSNNDFNEELKGRLQTINHMSVKL